MIKSRCSPLITELFGCRRCPVVSYNRILTGNKTPLSISSNMLHANGEIKSTSVIEGKEGRFQKIDLLQDGRHLALAPIDVAKRTAAFAAAEANLRAGQCIGVGSGTTCQFLVEYLAEKYRDGSLTGIVCIPTSFLTRKWLIDAGLPVGDLEQYPELDICIDGADEVDVHLNCIKGGGGCHTREKIVQTCARRFVLIADDQKRSQFLGQRYPTIPIEILPFGYEPTMRRIRHEHGGECVLRMARNKCGPIVTDNGNYIVDWAFPRDDGHIESRDWHSVHRQLLNIPGVVETGLFLDAADCAYFASPLGVVDVVQKENK